jgi:hypothetical protein
MFRHWDRRLSKKLVNVLRVFPNPRAVHVCTGSGRAMLGVILPIAKYVMGRHLRLRLVIHSGSDNDLLDGFERYGLGRDHLKSVVLCNESVVDNYAEWLEEQARIERKLISK